MRFGQICSSDFMYYSITFNVPTSLSWPHKNVNNICCQRQYGLSGTVSTFMTICFLTLFFLTILAFPPVHFLPACSVPSRVHLENGLKLSSRNEVQFTTNLNYFSDGFLVPVFLILRMMKYTAAGTATPIAIITAIPLPDTMAFTPDSRVGVTTSIL